MPAYRVSSHTLVSHNEIQADWLRLQKNADCSYFQSWGWIGTWLNVIAADLETLLVKVWQGDELVGMGVFVNKSLHRHFIIGSRALFLHEYPFDSRNMVIEYNGILALPQHRQSAYREVISHLFETNSQTDEIFFGAVSENEKIPLFGELDWTVRVEDSSSAWFVNLEDIDPGVDAYLSTLSKNRRGQVKRSIRLFEQQGHLNLRVAETSKEALEYFDGLKMLHTTRWTREGKLGSFANKRWEGFHRSIISERLLAGEVHLIKVSNSQGDIGFLYNLIWRGRVYVLQTGFKQYKDKRLMPGYVIHVLAIAYYKQRGMKVYDLMHGDSLYKRILCNREELLNWHSVQRNRLKFALEDRVVGFVRSLRGD